jgi:GT2 family glycosyltransferase
MSEPSERVRALATEREAARAAKDFAKADALRAQIEAEGFVVKDSASGPQLEPAPRATATQGAPRFATVDAAAILNALAGAPACEVSFHLLYEGFKEDLERFLAGFRAHNDTTKTELVVVDNASGDGEWIETLDGVRAIHLATQTGWAQARNAGIKTSAGRIVVLVDLSIEPAGDVVAPLLEVFDDPKVGVAGPFGLVSDSMREWEPTDGPAADAIEGYFLAVRREALAQGLVHEKFRWYRNADIDLSFQVRALGYEARVVPLPVVKHAHRGWESVPEPERSKRSKRNHYLFFGRWKDRPDLLLRHHRGTPA